MQASAEPRRGAGVEARASSSAGRLSAPAPSCPSRIIASRRWSMGTPLSPPVATGGRSPSVVEQELRAVEHRPGEVFRGLAALSRAGLQVADGEVLLVRRREPCEVRQVQLLDQLPIILLLADQPG